MENAQIWHFFRANILHLRYPKNATLCTSDLYIRALKPSPGGLDSKPGCKLEIKGRGCSNGFKKVIMKGSRSLHMLKL